MSTHNIRLILRGWYQVTSGSAMAGDKYWCSKLGVWLPVTVNSGTQVEEYAAVIRKD